MVLPYQYVNVLKSFHVSFSHHEETNLMCTATSLEPVFKWTIDCTISSLYHIDSEIDNGFSKNAILLLLHCLTPCRSHLRSPATEAILFKTRGLPENSAYKANLNRLLASFPSKVKNKRSWFL